MDLNDNVCVPEQSMCVHLSSQNPRECALHVWMRGASGGAGPQLPSERQSEAVGRVGATAWRGQRELPNEVLMPHGAGAAEQQPSIIGGDNCSGSQWGPARWAPFGLGKNEHSFSGHLSNLAGSLIFFFRLFPSRRLFSNEDECRATSDLANTSRVGIPDAFREVKTPGGAEFRELS